MSDRKVIKPKTETKNTSKSPDYTEHKKSMQQVMDQNAQAVNQAPMDVDRTQDQYASSLVAKDDSGASRKVVIPARTAQADSNPQEKKVNEFVQVDDNRPLSYQDKRAEDISKIINAYDKASKERAFRSRQTGTGAASIALSNPAAARQYANGRKNYEDQPIDSITGGQKAGQEAIKTESGVTNLADNDQERDPNSEVSNMYRQQLRKYNIKVSDTATAYDMKRVFPFIQTGIKKDTAERGQDIAAQTKDEDRASREHQGEKNRGVKVSQGNKNREVKVSEGQANRKAGVGKVILGGALKQDLQNSKGSGAGEQSLANAATIPDAFNGKGFYVTKPGMPPDKDREKKVSDLGSQAAKYDLALSKIEQIMSAPENQRATIFNKNWPTIHTLMANATQRNVKAMGNGVANGPDIEMAVKAIGSPNDIVTWIRNGLPQKLAVARQSVRDEYNRTADSMGYQKSDKPSEMTTTGGTGGSSSSRKPVNPATSAGANQVANDYGFPNVVAQPNPQPAGGLVPGQVYDTAQGKMKFIGINPQTGKRQWSR